MRGRNVSKYLSGGRKKEAYGRYGAGSGGKHTPHVSQHVLMAFSADTVQTLLTPTDPPCPISFEKSSAIGSALHWVYQGVICRQCTFHPIVNFQWCIRLLESGQPFKARPRGPLPPTHSRRHTSPLFLSWPETQSAAWGRTCVLEGGEVRGFTGPQGRHTAVVMGVKNPSINAVLQHRTLDITFCNFTVDIENTCLNA